MLNVVDSITYRVEQGNTPITVYLDPSKAIDTLNHSIVTHKSSILQHSTGPYLGGGLFYITPLAIMQHYRDNEKKIKNDRQSAILDIILQNFSWVILV